jgi:hypothetical protein
MGKCALAGGAILLLYQTLMTLCPVLGRGVWVREGLEASKVSANMASMACLNSAEKKPAPFDLLATGRRSRTGTD